MKLKTPLDGEKEKHFKAMLLNYNDGVGVTVKRLEDEKGNLCSYERFTYYVEEDNYPGNSVLKNGEKYRWRITLYQEMVADGSVQYPTEEKYYDMTITSGKVLGSTNERIQTALVADDNQIVSGLVLIDKYIQPVQISNLD